MEFRHTEGICLGFFYKHCFSILLICSQIYAWMQYLFVNSLKEKQHRFEKVLKKVTCWNKQLGFLVFFQTPPNKYLCSETGECFGEMTGLKQVSCHRAISSFQQSKVLLHLAYSLKQGAPERIIQWGTRHQEYES